jgi:hypothetical protein
MGRQILFFSCAPWAATTANSSLDDLRMKAAALLQRRGHQQQANFESSDTVM